MGIELLIAGGGVLGLLIAAFNKLSQPALPSAAEVHPNKHNKKVVKGYTTEDMEAAFLYGIQVSLQHGLIPNLINGRTQRDSNGNVLLGRYIRHGRTQQWVALAYLSLEIRDIVWLYGEPTPVPEAPAPIYYPDPEPGPPPELNWQ
jgi:hypothetical protein